jgi:hypothetical protein
MRASRVDPNVPLPMREKLLPRHSDATRAQRVATMDKTSRTFRSHENVPAHIAINPRSTARAGHAGHFSFSKMSRDIDGERIGRRRVGIAGRDQGDILGHFFRSVPCPAVPTAADRLTQDQSPPHACSPNQLGSGPPSARRLVLDAGADRASSSNLRLAGPSPRPRCCSPARSTRNRRLVVISPRPEASLARAWRAANRRWKNPPARGRRCSPAPTR